MNFQIAKCDTAIYPALVAKVNNLAKPKGALGLLEELAVQVGMIQQTLSPRLAHPRNIIFAADHGIAEEGVSFTPKEVTWQQTINFTKGGGGVNFFCRQHGFDLDVVDAGVDFDFSNFPAVINKKVARGTHSFLNGPAMSYEQMEQCIASGADLVKRAHSQGCNVISFGEMGVGNTSPSSIWMSYFTGISLEQCVGAGSGLDVKGISHKLNILQQSMDNYSGDGTPIDIIRYFGGFEMVMAIGAMLQAAELKMIVLVDGFIMSACMLAASRLYPEVLEYAVFGHQGDEAGHLLLLNYLGAKPLLHLGLRLGEGTGAICAYPILDSAIRMMNELETFAHADVTKYYE